MKTSDRAIAIGVAILGLLAACWFLLLSPKRNEAAKLGAEVTELEAEVAGQEALIAEGAAAEDAFDSNYQQLIVLGKAVPEAADTSSLITELSELSERTRLQFRSLDLVQGGSAAPPPPAAQTTADGATPQQGEEAEEADTTPAAATHPAVATEAGAASLPIGATVGPAGLPLMPYEMEFTGGFFEFADFLERLDGLVHADKGQVVVDGRLLTVDGFSFAADPRSGFPSLVGSLALSSYVAPSDQGLVGGATPAAPAAAAPAPDAPAAPAAPEPTATSTTP